MRTVRAVDELRAALAPARREGRTIGLVPTMGALHDGHLSLIGAARAECDVVVVSLFVNPAQFNERADLERYPRREQRDADLAAAAGRGPAVRAVRRGGLPARLRDRRRGVRRDRPAGGRRPRRRALPRREHRRDEAARHGDARRRLLRPEGRPAGRRDPPAGRRPEPARPHPGLPDGARARRPGDVQPQRPPERRAALAGARAAGRPAGGLPARGRGRALGRGSARRRARRDGSPRRGARVPGAGRSRDARAVRAARRARPCWRSPRGSARRG